jgi:hypothetical protein
MSKLKVTTISDPDNDNTALTIDTDGNVAVAGAASGTVTVDNDLSFDMTVGNNFSCTRTGPGTMNFTNIVEGQSGNIFFKNTGDFVISAQSIVKISVDDLTKISTTGEYFLSYFSPDGTNVMVSSSGAVTASGI